MLSPISTLPNDVLVYVLRFLPLNKLGEVCRVSQLWNRLASSDGLWKSYPLSELFPKITFVRRDVLKDLGINLERPFISKVVYSILRNNVYQNVVSEQEAYSLKVPYLYLGRLTKCVVVYFKDIVQISGIPLKLIKDCAVDRKDTNFIQLAPSGE